MGHETRINRGPLVPEPVKLSFGIASEIATLAYMDAVKSKADSLIITSPKLCDSMEYTKDYISLGALAEQSHLIYKSFNFISKPRLPYTNLRIRDPFRMRKELEISFQDSLAKGPSGSSLPSVPLPV